MWPLTAASLFSITSALVVADDQSQGACPNPFVGATNPEMLGVINPNARPHIDCARVTFSVEGLYWNAHQDGLEFAIENTEAPNLANNQVSLNHSSAFYNGTLLHPKSKWDFGFRIGLGYDLTHDGWDITADWTHFRTTASKELEADSQTSTSRLYTLYSAIVPGTEVAGVSNLNSTHVTVNPTAESAEARWKLHLDIIDLELGREFYTSKYLTLRPHMGLRGASIRQKYDIDYRGGTFTEDALTLHDEIDLTNNFWGIGVRGGLNSMWHWSRGCGGDWSFYGNLALSLVYGHFSIEEYENVEDIIGVDSIPHGTLDVVSTDNSFRASRAMTDLALGLRYDYDCSDSNYHIALWLGWEHHIAFSMNQWARYSSIIGTSHSSPTSPATYTNYVPQDGDLTTQGWTLGFAIDF